MALFNYASKELTLKVVYYGPGLSGKTTNLQHLHSVLEPEKKGKLISLATESDRTLFFDFLPVDLGRIRDFRIKFQLYTVPGQIRYNATRRLVLKGADAVVFIADSQRQMRESNIESLENMRDNLMANGIDPYTIPTVLQFNKRDLKDILSVEEMNEDLNTAGGEAFESVAVEGRGVEETFRAVTKLLIKDFSRRYNVQFEKARASESVAEVKPTSQPAPSPIQPLAQQAMAFEPPARPAPDREAPEALREETAELLEAVTVDAGRERGIEKDTVEPPWEEEEYAPGGEADDNYDLSISTGAAWFDEASFSGPADIEKTVEIPGEPSLREALPAQPEIHTPEIPVIEEPVPAAPFSEEPVAEVTVVEGAAETFAVEEPPTEGPVSEEPSFEEPDAHALSLEGPLEAPTLEEPGPLEEPPTEPVEEKPIPEGLVEEPLEAPAVETEAAEEYAGSMPGAASAEEALGAVGELKEEVNSALDKTSEAVQSRGRAQSPPDSYATSDRHAVLEINAGIRRLSAEVNALKTAQAETPSASDSLAEMVGILRDMKRDQNELLQAIKELRRDIALASTRRKKKFGIFG